jgi:hypothetical protein
MNKSGLAWVVCVALALAPMPDAGAQGAAPAAKAATASPAAATSLDVLKGSWVRPDGGYVIAIRGVGPNGQLDATYHNPKALPFARAQAMQVGGALRAVFELQAGGYAGSTYELTYDAANDRLKGVFRQAVVKQVFEVTFLRRKA